MAMTTSSSNQSKSRAAHFSSCPDFAKKAFLPAAGSLLFLVGHLRPDPSYFCCQTQTSLIVAGFTISRACVETGERLLFAIVRNGEEIYWPGASALKWMKPSASAVSSCSFSSGVRSVAATPAPPSDVAAEVSAHFARFSGWHEDPASATVSPRPRRPAASGRRRRGLRPPRTFDEGGFGTGCVRD